MFIPVTLCVWLWNSFQTDSTEGATIPWRDPCKISSTFRTIPYHTSCRGRYRPNTHTMLGVPRQ